VGLRGARVAAAAQGPSCLYVGPIETASQEKLEALYHQVLASASPLHLHARKKLLFIYSSVLCATTIYMRWLHFACSCFKSTSCQPLACFSIMCCVCCVQARDSYYSGQPLIIDDMFDKVEVKQNSSCTLPD
jgi:hypothetical protein